MGLFILIFLIIAIDQISKWYIKTNMELGQSIPIIDNVFHLTYSVNPGAAFGILAHRTTFFIIMTIGLLLVILYLFYKLNDNYKLVKFALALQFGGAVGNLIDRIRTGYVVDFFDFRVWPIFNVADVAIVMGVSILVYFILFSYKETDDLF
ncbi:signal peptidase II [Natranaerobius trueperi]|uniref:Lipoprotein signal peptidase n=1 Tax=Natranaerobius trueperi TaxID=759412 RepID=A0A226BZ61_9FIRM|nr:signal peptidase II [Natranaerobius trueperi]OWZ84211.1 signal peptidase II [Natranaerobius trueperi]